MFSREEVLAVFAEAQLKYEGALWRRHLARRFGRRRNGVATDVAMTTEQDAAVRQLAQVMRTTVAQVVRAAVGEVLHKYRHVIDAPEPASSGARLDRDTGLPAGHFWWRRRGAR